MANRGTSWSIQLLRALSYVLVSCVGVLYSVVSHDSLFLIATVSLLVISVVILVLVLLSAPK